MKNQIEIDDFSNISHLSILMSLDGRLFFPIKHSNIIELELLVKEITQKEPDSDNPSILGIRGELKMFGEVSPCTAEFNFEKNTGRINY
ncbi:MAG: hypothetical protein WCG25_08115 [bacterium]